jgi:hypothetical protein
MPGRQGLHTGQDIAALHEHASGRTLNNGGGAMGMRLAELGNASPAERAEQLYFAGADRD